MNSNNVQNNMQNIYYVVSIIGKKHIIIAKEEEKCLEIIENVVV